MDEQETRKTLIDPALRLAGWDVDNPAQVTQELAIELAGEVAESVEPYSSRADQFTDYALKISGSPVAVLEAKRTSKDPGIGQEQALKYAQALQRRNGEKLPFIFYTNGHEKWFWDSESYPPAKIYGFPTPDDLSLAMTPA